MFLVKLVWFLVTLPFRLALFAMGLAFWVLTLPLRIVFGTLALIGLGRVAQLAIVGAVGYFFYKLVNPDPEDLLPPAPTQAELNKVPST
ncbi:MAG TPA: hypothetical protein VFX49_03335 [Chloroflexota bacterium]|nr:hypothetical protein [Chloroflexota bacterium]